MVTDGVLESRERRNEEIKRLSTAGDVASIKANVPGFDKNTPTAKLLVAYFSALATKKGAKFVKKLSGADGESALFLLNNGKAYKRKFVEIEEKHPLGRFIDIDVTLKNAGGSLSRKKLRKCFLCNQPAFYCGRMKTHTASELLRHMQQKTEEYFTRILSEMIEKSMLKELNESSKFGLVCKNTNGSHTDLDYKKMRRAINAVKTPLARCFFVGLNANTCEGLLAFLRPIGKKCEEEMYGATGGANAYKGFIFIGGVLLASVGYLIGNSLPLSNLQEVIKSVCKGIDDGKEEETFGYKAYREDGFGGIRGLCAHGFEEIIAASKTIEKQPLLQSLCNLVGAIDDSVLLKRSGTFERYLYFKNLISSTDINDKRRLKKVNKECIQNNISIGGAADCLIASVLLSELINIFAIGEV